jgi:CheY-like chemotaxis protein/anti-sigma regulatory factor (Ser/Thr protein kinase)
VRKTVDLFASQFQAKGVQLSAELSARSTTIMGDAGRLRQVVSNLLGNALKFTPQGGSVRVRTYDGPDGHFVLEITDSGVGIEAAALQRIFSPFEQADASTTRQFGGLGIGLTISKVLVELHNGTIHAQSPGLGKGATILVSLPTCPISAAVPPPAQAPSAGGDKHKLRILVVEDNVDSLRMLERLLRALGYEIVSAQTASEALNAVAQSKFDLLISDIGLPDVSGWELMRMVRRERQQAIRGIALSGFVADSDRRRSLDAGYLCHIAKPIELNQLIQAIEGAMAANPAPLVN